MALWKPNETVGKNESIGRRLFHREGLRGAKDQTLPANGFPLYHFEDTRDGEISLDRLGATSVDRKVKWYLTPRCHHVATSMAGKPKFQGWAVAKARAFQTPAKGRPLPILPSPIAEEAGKEFSENIFHAHVERPASHDALEMALRLQYIFERDYNLEPSVPLAPDEKPTGLRQRFVRWVRSLWN